MRDGERVAVPAVQLVLGDLVVLEAGDAVAGTGNAVLATAGPATEFGRICSKA